MAAPDVRRRFTILDAMVLVAASGAGFLPLPGFLELYRTLPIGTTMLVKGLRASAFAAGLLEPCVVTWTLALLWLRLFVTPRVPRHVLARRSGWLALAIVCSILAIESLLVFVGSFGYSERIGFVEPPAIMTALPGADPLWLIALDLIPLPIGPAVAVSWLTLAVAGGRESGGDWIDRAGQILGWYWIIAAPICFCAFWTA